MTPALRYYTQTRGRFLQEPAVPARLRDGQDYTADTRLSSFGAITAG